MNPASLSAFANHLWQSTLFAGVAGLLTLALRKNRARVRHWVWLAASCKFLVPISALIALGGKIEWHTVPETTRSNLFVVMDQVSRPFTAPSAPPPWLAPPHGSDSLPAVLWGVWACGFLGIACSWWVRWWRLRAAVRSGSPLQIAIPFPAKSSPMLLEPGVFGIFRPVLLLPEGIFEQLTPAQLQAVVTHELCHVRHRDNLAAAIHMFVETVFWFHPLVWWIGKQVVEERERGCDEEVLRLGSEARVYAEGILTVCRLYVESPLVCVSGVTGSNIEKRIQAILSGRIVHRLSFARKAALTSAGMAALALPIVVGMMNAPPVRAQSAVAARMKFEAASIQLNQHYTGLPINLGPIGGGRFRATNIPLLNLIAMAYRLQELQVAAAPGWLLSERYDVEAKAGLDDLTAMLQPLFEDRLRLKYHRETREMPIYALVVAEHGKLHAAEGDCGPPPSGPPALADLPHGPCGSLFILPKRLVGEKVAISRTGFQSLVSALSRVTGHIVLDQTNLAGKYDIDLQYGPARHGSANRKSRHGRQERLAPHWPVKCEKCRLTVAHALSVPAGALPYRADAGAGNPKAYTFES
jgi:bla regulator protein BlaR1